MQTKKRAKAVKFGVKPKVAEPKTEIQEEEPVVKAGESTPQLAALEKTETPVSQPKQGGDLVDKLSDVPFETDFGTPSESTATPEAPTAPSESEFLASPAAPPAPVDITKPENVPSPEIDVNAIPAVPPIGHANEPVPFNPHETVFNTPPDSGEKKKNPFLYFLIIAFVAFLTGLAFMGGIYYAMPNKNFFKIPTFPVIIPQATATPAPSAHVPTVAPTVTSKPADYSVKVLNGSGVSGLAAKVKSSLEAEGFTVASTGNAATSDVVKTQVTYKKTVSKEALAKVLTVLKKSYTLEAATELPASATKESDITITIGKEAAK